MHHRPSEHAPTILAQNRRHYEGLVGLVRHYADQGDAERVLRGAMVAANYAWLAPVGLLSDLRLERLVVSAVRGSGTVTVDGDRRRGRVLHVLSEAYAVGGHTRQASLWIARDERTSDVVLTNQRGPVPARLADAVRGSGGELHDLQSPGRGLLDRARALREHMDRADLVVLTVHPHDTVALAAVNLPGVRPPVVYANHGDHAYWLGVAAADLLCDWRTHARPLDTELRGVAGERIGVLPLPMDAMTTSSGEALRRELGIRPDATVAVTVSADWKVAPAWGRGMHHVVDRVLRWSPKLTVVLVGCAPNAEWARLGKRYPGRILPVGMVPDPAPYLGLADIFLESYPLRAGTTPLEAAMVGLPVVALADIPEDERAHIFHTGSPGLDGLAVATSESEFAVAVHRLVRDADLRRREGDAVRAAVRAAHDGPGWLAQLESVYAQARALPAVDVDALGESPTDDRYGAMVLSASSPGGSPDPRTMAGPLGDLFDSPMQTDLLAVLMRRASPSLLVRVAPGWEDEPSRTTRLLALAAPQPRLTISLPFVDGDDAQGARSVASLRTLLDALGQTPEDCGDIRLEAQAAHTTESVRWEVGLSDEDVDRVERVVSSPLWREEPAATAAA